MEKRKLAKIPREEASDEMVRFAERAAGTHIVTTRDIEKDLLMVTFYPIGKLKKGEKGAQLRTFFSKNDYISQDLTSERVKWLTAAFDRMECIHLYEYHWDRDKGNRYTPNMFFWTDADIDRMRSFFKELSTEKDARDWTAVTRFQDMVKQRRLDEKHAKETNPIDALMETVKEIPDEFKNWVSDKAMSFSRYLIYSTSLFDIWFQDYSNMLSEKMTPVWEQAFLEGWKNNSLFCGAEDVINSESWVRSWIVDHTGDLITNCCNEQVSAIRYLIAEAESLNMSSAETARYIRPTIGLTERQAAANLKYYNSIKERLATDHPRMKPESIERKAREAASKYAERQQRYRAETIARSEIAQAYNHGADAFVREWIQALNSSLQL